MSPRSSETANTMVAIVQLANLVTRRLAPVLSRFRITPQQWGVLSVIVEAEELPTMAEISRQLMVSKQNITGMVTRLEALGLVKRAADPHDLRAVRIGLTRRGQQVADAVAPVYRRWIEAALGELSAGERKTLNKAVVRLLGDLAEQQ
jgi:DNA-binding MarR family transcriptional regulator